MNLSLTAGQSYYAYDTTNGVASPDSGDYYEGAVTSRLAGAMYFSTNTAAVVGAAGYAPPMTQPLPIASH